MRFIVTLLLVVGILAPAAQLPAQSASEGGTSPDQGAFQRSPIRLILEQERALSPDEPMYLIVGTADDEDDDFIARFQLSFKYRIFDPGSIFGRELTAARNLYFAYTQTSLWNWSEDSAPFEDTTYRPSFFWQELLSGHGLVPDAGRFGFEHASNGQAEENSRSMNTVFLRPMWWTELAGRELVVAPKFSVYLEKSDNEDIDDFYGNAEWLVRYGSETSWMVETTFRGRSTNRGSLEVNLSYPIRDPLFYNAGGFVYVQYFEGYGESLLDYDVKSEPTLRIGFAIVR